MTGAAAGGGGGKGGNSTRAASVEALAEHVRSIYTHDKARFVLKYRHADGKLSLRVTDDVKTAKYKTRRQAELGKVKRLVGMVVTGKEPAATAGAEHASSPVRKRGGKGGKRAKKG